MSTNYNIILVGRSGYFKYGYKSGAGILRYAYSLYTNLKKISTFGIKTVETPLPKPLVPGNGLLSDKIYLSNRELFTDGDIIHYTDPSVYLPKLNKKIVISTIHDLIPILEPAVVNDIPKYGYLKYNFIRKPIHLLNKFSVEFNNLSMLSNLKNSTYLIANSTQTKEEVLAFGIKNKKIKVINLGLDRRFIKSVKSSKHNNFFGVGYIGGLVYRKNIDFAIKAIKEIKEDKIILNIYGNLTRYARMLQENYPDKRIKFLGFVPEEQIVKIYDSFNVFVFPSLYEGFGLPILEAQARGLPVIIYKYGKIPKEVRKYCFEAESPDHMAQIIENIKENGYNKKVMKKAMEYARGFTWEKTAKETLEMYKKVV